MNATNTTGAQPTHEEIAAKAYQLWEKGGRQPGQDTKYWLQAEKELCAARRAAEPAPKPIVVATTTIPWAKPAGKRSRAQAR